MARLLSLVGSACWSGFKRIYCLTDVMCQQAGRGRHADGGGLYLFVRSTGSRSWIVRLTVGGRRRDFGLGPYPDVSLAEAREVAAEYRSLVRKGVDPRAARSRSAPTVREAVEAVINDRRHNWTCADAVPRYRRRFERHIMPAIGDKPVDAVTVDDCYAIVHPQWSGRGSLGFTIRHQLAHVMAWAVAHEFRTDNPADQLLVRLPRVKASTQHHPSLPFQKTPAALAALDAADVVPVLKLAICFIVLTAARLSEVTEARWSEFDLEDRLWTIPPDRMKKRRRHRVPLSRQALRILEEARALVPTGSLVFGFSRGRRPARPLTSAQISKVLRDLDLADLQGRPVVAHGFRATFTDWVADNQQASVEAAEAALAHAADSDTRQAYRRGDLLKPRRSLMQAWADYVLPPAGE